MSNIKNIIAAIIVIAVVVFLGIYFVDSSNRINRRTISKSLDSVSVVLKGSKLSIVQTQVDTLTILAVHATFEDGERRYLSVPSPGLAKGKACVIDLNNSKNEAVSRIKSVEVRSFLVNEDGVEFSYDSKELRL